MKNKVLHRVYVSGHLVTCSPVLIGNGLDEESDCDLICNGSGRPMLPGSSLAGAIRSALSDAGRDADSLFGPRSGELVQSPLMLYDALLAENASVKQLRSENKLHIRDCVRLNGHDRTAMEQGKFDFQVLEKGVPFDFQCELTGWETRKDNWSEDRQILADAIHMLMERHVCVGAKTSRGLGLVQLVDTRWLELDMPKDVQTWVDFDWEKTMKEKGILPPLDSFYSTIRNSWQFKVDFALQGPLIIRDYSVPVESNPVATDVNKELNEPDYVQFKAGPDPVVPGTSWAGALRHGMTSILQKLSPDQTRANAFVDKMFGPHLDRNEREKRQAIRSALTVCEGSLEQVIEANYTRNRIDRFTGGVIGTALFTAGLAMPLPGASVTLLMTLDTKGAEDRETQARIGALYLTLCDMAHGLLPIGGEVGVGRGILAAETVQVVQPDGVFSSWKLDGSEAKEFVNALCDRLQKETL